MVNNDYKKEISYLETILEWIKLSNYKQPPKGLIMTVYIPFENFTDKKLNKDEVIALTRNYHTKGLLTHYNNDDQIKIVWGDLDNPESTKMQKENKNKLIILPNIIKLQEEYDSLKNKSPENKVKEMVQKIEITAIPDINVKNSDESTITKGKKRIHLPKFKPTPWAKITIRFLDERNIIINTDNKKQAVANYESFGFSNEKRDKPNLTWKLFYELATNNGETKTLPTPIPDNIKQQKRKLSDRLKTIFNNDTDPFYYSTDTHIYKIKISLIPPEREKEEKEEDDLGIKEYLKETMTQEPDKNTVNSP